MMMFFTPGELFPWTVGYETVTAAGIGHNMAPHCRWSFQNGSLFGSEKEPDTAWYGLHRSLYCSSSGSGNTCEKDDDSTVFPNIMVLSGMSNIEQMRDNISFMKDFRPLNEKGQEAVKQVTEVFPHLPIRELLKQAAAEFE